MAMIEEYGKQGNFLFTYRSYFPLIFIASGFVVFYFNRSQTTENLPLYLELIYLFIGLLGVLLRIVTVGHAAPFTSGRNKYFQRADSLNESGIYSQLRHPLYLANFLMWLSLALYVNNYWFVALFVLSYWYYYERIMFAEELYLREKFGTTYLKWAEETPAVVPKFKDYKKPVFSFNAKKIFRAEVNGIFSLFLVFTAFNSFENYLSDAVFLPDLFWSLGFLFVLVVYLILKVLKKGTNLFNDDIVDVHEVYYENLKRKKQK